MPTLRSRVGISDWLSRRSPDAIVVRAIDVSASPKSAFFGRNCIDNHPAHGFGTRRVEPANQEQDRVSDFSHRLETLKVRIVKQTRDLPRKQTKRGQFRIYRRFAVATHWTAGGLIALVGTGDWFDL